MKNINYKKYISNLILLAVFIFNIYLSLKYGKGNLDSDMSSEMILSDLMNKHGDLLFCSNWAYSSEMRVIYLQAIFRLGLLLFPNNWYYARVLSTSILLLLLIILFIKLCNLLGLKKYSVWLAVVLICPFSFDYNYIVVYGAFYIPHILLYLLLFYLIILYAQKKKMIYLILSGVFSLIGGMVGPRIIYNYIFPLFVSSIISLIILCKKKNIRYLFKEYFNKYISVIIQVICCGVGYLINVFYLLRKYNFYNFNSSKLNLSNIGDLPGLFTKLFKLFGWRDFTSLRNGNYLLSIFSLTFILVLVIVFIWSIRNNKRFINLNNRIELTYFISVPFAILECVVLFLIMDQIKTTYWAPFIPFLLIYVGYFLNYSNISLNIKNLILACLLLSVTMTSIETIIDFVNRDKNGKFEDITNYLLENNLTQGYGTFWNANVLTELSNGEIEIWVLNPDVSEGFNIYNWLQSKDHMNNEPINEKVFLVSGTSNMLGDSRDEFDTSHFEDFKVYENGYYSIYVFDSDQIDNYLKISYK